MSAVGRGRFHLHVEAVEVSTAACGGLHGEHHHEVLAESKAGFLKAKAVNCAVALAVGFGSWGLISLL